MAQIEACQLCLCNTKLLRGLNKEIESLIKTKILDYLSINIHYKNNTPIVICEDCLNNLNQFHIFAQTVYLAQRNFQKKSKLFKYETTNIEDNLPLSMQKQRNNMISQIEFNNPNAKTPNI
ncbi:uncharacterized protein LOC113374976 [Ctenocephalides felis]|uniref:uncharacterized protein LOC113374976 n=1 Tax=Ctenocephalides felis TaxID=7515 RepID=UPI000E6E18DF|nr:uncharacterized protein LOC113374976 [Ctenocephalides felis]